MDGVDVPTNTGRISVEVDCDPCGGTGIYRGYKEPPGVGVRCIYCDGYGKRTISYTPFIGRKLRSDINEVRNANGRPDQLISYQEFLAGKRP